MFIKENTSKVSTLSKKKLTKCKSNKKSSYIKALPNYNSSGKTHYRSVVSNHIKESGRHEGLILGFPSYTYGQEKDLLVKGLIKFYHLGCEKFKEELPRILEAKSNMPVEFKGDLSHVDLLAVLNKDDFIPEYPYAHIILDTIECLSTNLNAYWNIFEKNMVLKNGIVSIWVTTRGSIPYYASDYNGIIYTNLNWDSYIKLFIQDVEHKTGFKALYNESINGKMERVSTYQNTPNGSASGGTVMKVINFKRVK